MGDNFVFTRLIYFTIFRMKNNFNFFNSRFAAATVCGGQCGRRILLVRARFCSNLNKFAFINWKFRNVTKTYQFLSSVHENVEPECADGKSVGQGDSLKTVEVARVFCGGDFMHRGDFAVSEEACVGDHGAFADVDVLANSVERHDSVVLVGDAWQLLALERIFSENLQSHFVRNLQALDIPLLAGEFTHLDREGVEIFVWRLPLAVVQGNVVSVASGANAGVREAVKKQAGRFFENPLHNSAEHERAGPPENGVDCVWIGHLEV